MIAKKTFERKYFKFIQLLLKKNKSYQILGLAFTVLYSFFVFLGPIISQHLVDEVVYMESKEELNRSLIIFAVIFLLQPITLYIQNNIFINISEKITLELRSKLFSNILRKEIQFYQKNTKGEILSRLLNDTRILSDFVADFFIIIVKNSLLVISIIIGMFMICWYITLFILILLILFVVIILYFSKKIRILSQKRQISYDEVTSYIADSINNFIAIRIYNIFEKRNLQYRKHLNENKKSNIIIRKTNNLYTVLLEFITILCVISIYEIGFKQVINDVISIGNVIALVLYFQLLISPLISLLNCNINFQIVVPIIDRIQDFLDLEQDIEYKSLLAENFMHKKNIVIRDLCFGYQEKEKIFNDYNESIEFNTLTCIKGDSGVGKSTLVNLLLGILKPLSGDIYMGQHSIYKNDNKFKILLVPQNCQLFHMSIMENIKLENPEISNTQVFDICIKLNIFEDINLMSEGFDTIISDHINISGGQAQRILIARALAHNPSILILDEPTSALDETNRDSICKLLKDLRQFCTILVVTHDEKFLTIADKVIELTKKN